MNKKAFTAMEGVVVGIILLLIVTTMFLLSYLGVIPQRKYENTEVLQADFIPYVREGKLVITDLKLCEALDAQKNCVNEKTTFTTPATVSVRAVVETTSTNGKVFLLENYVVRRADGTVVMAADSDLPFEMDSQMDNQQVLFTDFFTVSESMPTGRYTFELIVKDQLMNREVTAVRELKVER